MEESHAKPWTRSCLKDWPSVSRGYTCMGSPAAVKPESSSSNCLQVREFCSFNRWRFQQKTERLLMSITRARDKSRTELVKTCIFLFCIFLLVLSIFIRGVGRKALLVTPGLPSRYHISLAVLLISLSVKRSLPG